MKNKKAAMTEQLSWVKDVRLLDYIKENQKKSEVRITRVENSQGIPSIEVTVPDSWPYIQLAPLYDVHLGNAAHEGKLFARHVEWVKNTPYTLTWNGGDFIENASKLSIGSGVYAQDFMPDNQLVQSLKVLAEIQNKLLFSIPGNHEDRTGILGIDLSRWLAIMMGVEYSPDYMFVTLVWRGNRIRLLAHHGAGGAATPGAQRMSLRKMPNIAHADIYWMGHLHSELVDKIVKIAPIQGTSEFERHESIGIISPSYVQYFNTYAAKKILPITSMGLTVVTIQPDGRLDVSTHAHGKRR